MNLRRLQAFRAVFEMRSVTRAAERLHMTQPAVSRLVGDLEQELGLALFVRQRRRLVPTIEGQAFYREAEKALAAVDQIVDIARDIRTLKGTHLRVVAPMLTAFGILPAAVSAFRALHPHTRISLEIKDLRDIADWVANGPFDIGVTALPFQDERVDCELLTTVRTVLVLPKRHRLAARRVVQLKDLRDENVILPSPSGNQPRAFIGAAFEIGRPETAQHDRCLVGFPGVSVGGSRAWGRRGRPLHVRFGGGTRNRRSAAAAGDRISLWTLLSEKPASLRARECVRADRARRGRIAILTRWPAASNNRGVTVTGRYGDSALNS